MSVDNEPKPKLIRGFAVLKRDRPERLREICSKGGVESHRQGVGHTWNSETASAAGKLGGKASRGGRGKVKATP